MKPDTGARINGRKITKLFELDQVAARLTDLFLGQIGSGAVELEPFAAAARGVRGENWGARRIAALQLEHLVWRTDPDRLQSLPALLGENPDDPHEFVQMLRRKIGRLARLHNALLVERHTVDTWAAFFHIARQECRLTLAKWLWSTQETMREIRSRLAVTRGILRLAAAIEPVANWGDGMDVDLPAWEMDIVNALRAANNLYWVTPRVGAELNALVEYPVNSASLVIKPPGSDMEIQIKRAGLRGAKPLVVLSERNGAELPFSHWLHGGSFGWLAEGEARASRLFTKIYTAVHCEPCPCNETVALSSVVDVPFEDRPVHILDYLTQYEIFGEGYEEMRTAMRRTIAASPKETGVKTPDYEGTHGETLQFIAQAAPRQAIQIHTTSYRLEYAADWLTETGIRKYLEATGREFSLDAARLFGCDVMDEILAGFTPAPGAFTNYGEFLDACFEIPANRSQADACYLSLLGQTGKIWGVLLAVRGYTNGESFVTRNSGIRSVWIGNDWKVTMRFMDHDDMWIAGPDGTSLPDKKGLAGMSWDELHIVGGEINGKRVKGIAGALSEIYRVSDETLKTGMSRLRENVRTAYRKTQSAVMEMPALRALFAESFVQGLHDLDRLAGSFLGADDRQTWLTEARAFLSSRDYSDLFVDDYLQLIQDREDYLRKMAFLFLPQP